MLTPFQRLLYHQIQGAHPRRILLAAAGPCLRIFDGTTGQLLSRWSHIEGDGTAIELGAREDAGGHPAKKRKVENGNVSDKPSAEILVENGSGRRKPKRKGSPTASITHLCSTRDGKHVVVITGEDKAIRVLTINENGVLQQFSKRIMPKRPSALTLAPNQETILCADKFGDVYSLPLFGKILDAAPAEALENGASEEDFVPSATNKTVHTKRNLKVLQEQQKAKKVKKLKTEPKFEHSLLFGHVSLLTDIVCIKIKLSETSARTYILTTDRDEHIRVSRGIPLAHVTESFCSGHDHFVSKMHVPPWLPEILLSAGGDNDLLIWEWRTGSVKQKVNMKDHLSALKLSRKDEISSIAVRGIWTMQTTGSTQIIVSFEATSALLLLALDRDDPGQPCSVVALSLPGNVLDVAVQDDQQSIIVSLDNIHEPCSSTIVKEDKSAPWVMKLRLDAKNGNGWNEEKDEMLKQINDLAADSTEHLTDNLDAPTLSSIFYTTEHLRKRGGRDDEEEEEEEEKEEEKGDEG